MKKIIILVLTLFIIISLNDSSFALSGSQIIKKSETAMRGSTTVAIYAITIKTRRWKRTLIMRSWDNRLQKKNFGEIISPKKDAGNRFLLINKTMYHFVPKLQKSYKISPSMMLQSWMGSDFTNDDIVKESSIVEDYFHKKTGTLTIHGHECYKVILTPRPEAAVVWGKIVYYARTKDCLPVQQEYYNEHGVKKKVMTYSKYKRMHDRVIPTIFKMQTIRKRNRYTILEIKNIRFNTGISPRTFSFQNLKRR